MTERVILLGCVASKRELAPDQRVEARDLYDSPLWRARRAYAEASGAKWLILSAHYGIIAPWTKIGTYPLVPTAELPGVIRSCEHWDRLADSAHIYMWVTNNFLADGLWLLEELGFRYVTNLVWVKQQFGIGYYFRGMHELVLFGVRGDTIFTEGTWSTVLGDGPLDHPRDERGTRIHSRKPEQLHQLIEQASPGAWLEIFARVPREGWLTWGNQLGGDE